VYESRVLLSAREWDFRHCESKWVSSSSSKNYWNKDTFSLSSTITRIRVSFIFVYVVLLRIPASEPIASTEVAPSIANHKHNLHHKCKPRHRISFAPGLALELAFTRTHAASSTLAHHNRWKRWKLSVTTWRLTRTYLKLLLRLFATLLRRVRWLNPCSTWRLI